MSQKRTESDVPERRGMPMLGLGTWQNDDPEQCVDSVATALDVGYRHIDTAQAYNNEESVGQGISESGVPRDNVFLATKVWIDNLERDDVIGSTERSLEKLDTDYLDLLYVHWPARTYDPEETLNALAELKDDGIVERIGVSNFDPGHLDRARDVLDGGPFANQVEMHPLLQQEDLREYANEHGIELVAYSPLARGKVFDVPELAEIADKHDVSEAQVSLAWLREVGVTAIPKATSQEHILDNWGSLDVELDSEDVSLVESIEETDRRVDPEFGPDSWS